MSAWQRFKYALPFAAWKWLCRSTWRACDRCGRRGRFKGATAFGGGRPNRYYCDFNCYTGT